MNLFCRGLETLLAPVRKLFSTNTKMSNVNQLSKILTCYLDQFQGFAESLQASTIDVLL